ncbi:MAG: plasmid pRiA4b ORF-3 family protein [Pirellulales bacterium]
MTWMKRIQPGERLGLKLTPAQRKLILDDLLVLEEALERTVRDTPEGKPVMLTLDELDDLGGCVAATANHCSDKRTQQKCDRILHKIDRLLNAHTDQDDTAISPDEVGRLLGKAMADFASGKDPGVISFQLKTPKHQQTAKYPIKLTSHQRESLISCTQLKRKIKNRLGQAADGTQTIEFTKQELDHMFDEMGEAAVYAPSPYKKRIVAVQNKVAAILDELQLEAFGIERPKKRRRPATKANLLFQFKITLLDIKPTIWRRIQVHDGTLGQLHEHIQAAMGWENYHMHQFLIDGERYGQCSDDEFGFDLEMTDEDEVVLSRLLPKSGQRARWVYEYDFGDNWRHELLFEGYPPHAKNTKYPLCLEGERACPPEDVGGPWGYPEYLEALTDPKHEQHKDLIECRGPFDPDRFDPKQATRAMKAHDQSLRRR